jgi:hypothetical protein
VKRLLVSIGFTVGSTIGWFVGASIGTMTAFMVSIVGGAAGVYIALRWAANNL